MKIAVMQPYIFPYIGYFQLVKSVDGFVIYDDVNFIKQGWVNRNRILANGEENLFTIPLKNASSFVPINETELHPSLYAKWKIKFLRTIVQNYSKAPYFSIIYPIIENVFKEEKNISLLATKSIMAVHNYLDLKTKMYISSNDFSESKGLDRVERLINISKKLNAETYINMMGGKDLYNPEYFKKQNIDLLFLKPCFKEYKQTGDKFIPGLSIIDVLMVNEKKTISDFLNDYMIE